MKKTIFTILLMAVALTAFAGVNDFTLLCPVDESDVFQIITPTNDAVELSDSVYEFLGDYNSTLSVYSSGDGVYEITAGKDTYLVVTENNEGAVRTAYYAASNTPKAIILDADATVDAKVLARLGVGQVYVSKDTADVSRYVRSLQSEGIRVTTYPAAGSFEYVNGTLSVRSMAGVTRPHHPSRQTVVAVCPCCGEYFTLNSDNCFEV